jgi:hypothetical protein
MSFVGYILLWTGLIAWTVGNFRFTVVVYRFSPGWFFACLSVPLAVWPCFLLYMRQTWKPMLIGTAGFLATFVGARLVARFGT